MSPSLRLRALRLNAQTANGEVGRLLRFQNGLNILRADNSSGKSTALQGIVYALGLEGMLSPSQRVPLTHAMTDYVAVDEVDGRIVESSVELEIENGLGQVVTVGRAVIHPTRDQRLVTVVEGALLTDGSSGGRATDFYVRRPGAAQNDAGFHRYLADFLGLELPRVTRLDGSESPLYLETLFPYFFVEQKHGWSGIQARIPTYLGIRDVGKRSAEFILGLDVFERTLQRQRLRSNMAELETEWQATSKQFTELAKLSRVVIQTPPGRIQHGVPANTAVPTVAVGNEWKPLAAALEQLRNELISSDAPVPTSGAAADETEEQLQHLEAALRESLAIASALTEERGDLERYQEQLDLRVAALREDLQRHKDTQLLQVFGSEHAHSLIADHICPTCHQRLEDGADISAHAMSISESIDFIQQQIATFTNMQIDQTRVIRALTIRQESLNVQIHDYRQEIRAARDTLSNANSLPSVAEISRRLTLQARIEELETRSGELETVRQSLSATGAQWAEQRRLLTEAERDELSTADQAKIDQVRALLRGQLREFGFSSLDPDEIDINPETYRPIHEGFDLGFDLSASDMIRAIWAYLFSLLIVGQDGGGNHLGLLIFDEPRQQDTAQTSYGALLARASAAGNTGAQVLFATSEPHESLTTMLAGHEYNLINLEPGEKLLQPGG